MSAAVAKPSRISRVLAAAERLLAWDILHLACFAVVTQKLLRDAGYGFDEYLAALIVYIGVTHRIYRIEQAVCRRGEQP